MSDDDKSNLGNLMRPQDKIGYLRAKAINSLVCQVVRVFMANLERLLEGTYNEPLIDQIESASDLEKVRSVSKDSIYSHRTILQIEAAGFQVIPGLLDMFLSALASPGTSSSKKILELLPDEYVEDLGKNPYDAIMSITDYVAGMTDVFAVELYRNLRGIQLPNY
jgi:dGTPase